MFNWFLEDKEKVQLRNRLKAIQETQQSEIINAIFDHLIGKVGFFQPDVKFSESGVVLRYQLKGTPVEVLLHDKLKDYYTQDDVIMIIQRVVAEVERVRSITGLKVIYNQKN